MTVRRLLWARSGGAAHGVRALLVVLFLLAAVPLHHLPADAAVTPVPAAFAPHGGPGTASAAAHSPTVSPATGAPSPGHDGAASRRPRRSGSPGHARLHGPRDRCRTTQCAARIGDASFGVPDRRAHEREHRAPRTSHATRGVTPLSTARIGRVPRLRPSHEVGEPCTDRPRRPVAHREEDFS
jgi:hypothetical protein